VKGRCKNERIKQEGETRSSFVLQGALFRSSGAFAFPLASSRVIVFIVHLCKRNFEPKDVDLGLSTFDLLFLGSDLRRGGGEESFGVKIFEKK
jgi:hypothetical protein